MKLPFVAFMALFTVWMAILVNKDGSYEEMYSSRYVSKAKCNAQIKVSKKLDPETYKDYRKQGISAKCVNVQVVVSPPE